jgi:hypothetical protein
MKTITITLIAIIMGTLGFAGNAFAQTGGQVTFIISNQQSEGLGQVTVSDSGGNSYVNVFGNSSDTATISDTATSITIFGQTVPQGQQAYVTLPDQTVVAVMWESSSEVVVVDKDEIN